MQKTKNDLQFYIDEWKKDSQVNRTELGEELSRVSNLHAKYLDFLYIERALLLKLEKPFKKLTRLRWEYWSGTLDSQVIREREWEPQPLKLLKTEIERYIDTDEVLVPIKYELDTIKMRISFLEDVVKNINNRGYNLRGAVDWVKFTSGQ